MKRAAWISTAWAPLAALLVLLVHSLFIQPWMLDDAFIFCRYAENWAGGHGPVYNPGERVEGYTSFLWLVLLTMGHRLGADTVLLAKALGGLFALGCIVLVWRAPRWLPQIAPRTAAIATLWLGTFGVFTPWAVSGMEVTLFAFLLTLSVLLQAGAIDRAADGRGVPAGDLGRGALGALLAMTRPEGLLVFALLCAHVARRHRARAAAMAGGCAVLFAPYFAWRRAYYGFLLPNTFYAKVGGSAAQLWRGCGYTGRFAIAAAPLLVLILAAVASRRWSKSAGRFGPVLLLLAAYAGFVLVVGGDVMPASRFFAPLAPLLALTAAVALASLLRPRGAALAAALVTGYGLFGILRLPDIHDRIRDDRVAEIGATVGLWLRQTADPAAVLATNTAGSIPYYSGLRTIDMFGLTDAHIAHRAMPRLGHGIAGHEKYDGRYVLSRRPDIIQFASSLGAEAPAFPGDKEIWASRDFQENYVLASYGLIGPAGGFTIHLYERQEGAARRRP